MMMMVEIESLAHKMLSGSEAEAAAAIAEVTERAALDVKRSVLKYLRVHGVDEQEIQRLATRYGVRLDK